MKAQGTEVYCQAHLLVEAKDGFQVHIYRRYIMRAQGSSVAKSSLTSEVLKLTPLELNMNSKSAASQIARAPNGEKIRKFPRVQNLTGATLFQVFACDYTRYVVCLPLRIINLSFSPFTLYSSSYPILRGNPLG